MGKAKPFLFGTLLGSGLMFMAMQYHIVRTHDGVQLIPRTPQQSLGLAYADIRQWDATRWTDRPELARAIIAHGSGALISQSVADSLTESVSSETATLDQLRQLLNRPTDGTAEVGASDSAAASPMRSPDPAGGQLGDGFAIPFPSEARKPEDDPYRIAHSSDAPLPLTGSNGSNSGAGGFGGGAQPSDSGFGALHGSNALPFGTGVGSPTTSRPAVPTQGSGTFGAGRPGSAAPRPPLSETQRQAEAAADAIFGGSTTPRPGAATSGSAAPGGLPTSSTTFGTSSTPFGDVSAELENRARAALSRAQSTLTQQAQSEAGSALNDAAGSAGGYVRGRLNGMVPEGARAVVNPPSAVPAVSGGTSGGAAPLPPQLPSTSGSLLDQFDPFLE